MITVKKFTFNPFQENSYILFDESKKCVIFDPGMYDEAERHQVEDYIKNQELEVEKLVNTHCHIDHIFGNNFISKKYNVELEAHKFEKVVLEHGPISANMYNINYTPSPEIKKFIDEKEDFVFGNSRLKVFFCPGHSPGSLCFYSEENKFVIAGDVLFFQSIGRTDLPGGDYATLINSIKTNLWNLPGATKVYNGHGQDTFIGYEKENNPFLK